MRNNSVSPLIFMLLAAVMGLSLASLGCSEDDERCAGLRTPDERRSCTTCTVYKKADDRHDCQVYCIINEDEPEMRDACIGGQILFLKPSEKSAEDAVRNCDEFYKVSSLELQKACRAGVTAEDGRYKNEQRNDSGTAGSDRENGNLCIETPGVEGCKKDEEGEGPKRQF